VKTGDVQGDWVKANNTTAANPFASEVKVEAEGQHTVEFRSTDKAGNVEATKSVAFGIDIPDPGFPVIEAFADPATGEAPLLTRFTASGYDPDGGTLSYKWEFADGTVLGRAATRTYTKPGTYTATVTATDDEGDTSSKEVTVTVTAPGVLPPTVELGSDVTGGPAAMSVKFTATGDDPDGDEDDLLYAWDFGDGSSSFEQNPVHTYLTKGTYTAKVTVSDGSGATASKTVVITVTDNPGNAAPTITGIGKVSPHGNPMQLQFTVQASDPENDKLTFEWDFDDGSAKATGADVTHTFTTAGTYTVKVTASDGKGGTATRTESVTVSPAANVLPTVKIAADPIQGTAPLPVQFSAEIDDPDGDRRNVKTVWTFGDGAGSGSAEPNPLHVYSAAGTYTATLTVTDARGGTTSKSITITVTAVQGGGNVTPPAAAPKAPDVTPAQAPWFGVSEPIKTSVSGFAKSGLSVKVTATEAMTGSAKLVVSSKVAKALGLKSTTLATVSVKFTGAGSKSVKFKASKAVKKALAKAKGSVKVTLSVSLKAQGEAASSSTRSVTLSRR
jgi:PKD repeat protein